MSSSGLFSGEVAESAPANGASTLKQKGFHWLQWGEAEPQTLTLINTVVNGPLTQDDFPSFVDATPQAWDASPELSLGLHTASETEQANYTASDWGGDAAADGTVTLVEGDNKIASITNTYTGYWPGMMNYDGSSWYSTSITTTGNLITLPIRIEIPAFTGGGYQTLTEFHCDNASFRRLRVRIYASDHSTASLRNKLEVFGQHRNLGTTLFTLYSTMDVTDVNHTIVLRLRTDPPFVLGKIWIDGVDDTDTGHGGHILMDGSMEFAGAVRTITLGADISGDHRVTGRIGYFGYRQWIATIDPLDFYNTTDFLQEVNESTWAEFDGQPKHWNQFGTMTDNKGTVINMTENGTITGPD